MDMGEEEKPKIIVKVSASSTSDITVTSDTHKIEVVKVKPK